MRTRILSVALVAVLAFGGALRGCGDPPGGGGGGGGGFGVVTVKVECIAVDGFTYKRAEASDFKAAATKCAFAVGQAQYGACITGVKYNVGTPRSGWEVRAVAHKWGDGSLRCGSASVDVRVDVRRR